MAPRDIFSNQPSCQSRGICQSTTGQCRKACHMALGEPPIGYEAAYISEEEADRLADSWAIAGRVIAGFVLLLIMVAGVVYSLINYDSFLHQLGRAAMSLG